MCKLFSNVNYAERSGQVTASTNINNMKLANRISTVQDRTKWRQIYREIRLAINKVVVLS